MAQLGETVEDLVYFLIIYLIIQKLLESYQYLLSVPGKNIRSTLIQIFQIWLQIPYEKLAIIEEIITSLHTSSLMYFHIVLE